MRHRLPWPFVTATGASVLAVLVAWGEVHNWGVFLQFLYQVPYGANDPLYDKDIGFYLFALRVCRHQELDAAHALTECALRGSDLLGPRPHRVRRPAPVDVADSDHSRLGATRLFLRGEGLVLRSRPLSAAVP